MNGRQETGEKISHARLSRAALFASLTRDAVSDAHSGKATVRANKKSIKTK